MKKKKIELVDKLDLHRMKVGKIRFDQVEQGFFDGRYRTKVVPSGKLYKRNEKYKPNHI
jgi:hypothetical protein